MPIRLATAMSGLISIANGGSRILFGSAFDRFGKDKTILIDSLIALAGTTVRDHRPFHQQYSTA